MYSYSISIVGIAHFSKVFFAQLLKRLPPESYTVLLSIKQAINKKHHNISRIPCEEKICTLTRTAWSQEYVGSGLQNNKTVVIGFHDLSRGLDGKSRVEEGREGHKTEGWGGEGGSQDWGLRRGWRVTKLKPVCTISAIPLCRIGPSL
jgi:hypothetical protein